MAEQQDRFVARFYTRARKFPRLLGVTTDGWRIPGGPYTYTQAIAGICAVFALSQTVSLWARGGAISTLMFGATLVWVVVYLVGRIPPMTYNPVWFVAGVLGMSVSPSTGKQRGQRVAVSKPYRARGTYRVDLGPAEPDDSVPGVENAPPLIASETETRTEEPATVPTPGPERIVTSSVGELLAKAVQNRSER